jgi:peroxiredoxin
MDTVLLASRLLLAGVFLLAAATKLADRRGSRAAMVGFGVPDRLAPMLAVGLPVAELAVAVALMPAATARWGAVGALGLLVAFVAGIGVSLARGRAPDCHCFGQLHSAPAGPATLARNAALALVAGVVVWGGRTSPSLLEMTAGEAGALALAAVAAVALVVLEWRRRTVARRVPAEGARAPRFRLPDLDGRRVALDDLLAPGRPLLLVFSDPACGPCNAMLPDLAAWQRDHGDALTIAVLSRRDADVNREKAQEHGLANVLLQREREVDEAYGAEGTPTGVLVNRDGTIAKGRAAGADAIYALVSATVGIPLAPPPAPQVAVGADAPAFELESLAGETVRLADTRGRRTLLLFWDPACELCAWILDDLLEWEAEELAGAPRLLVVSTGKAESVAVHGFRSTVLLDPGFEVGPRYGVRSTPSAVLVAADGTIASPLAVGSMPVLALAFAEEGETTPA